MADFANYHPLPQKEPRVINLDHVGTFKYGENVGGTQYYLYFLSAVLLLSDGNPATLQIWTFTGDDAKERRSRVVEQLLDGIREFDH